MRFFFKIKYLVTKTLNWQIKSASVAANLFVTRMPKNVRDWFKFENRKTRLGETSKLKFGNQNFAP